MLDQNDIKQISTIFKENIEENNKKLTKDIVGQVVVEVGEFITENVLTAIDATEERLSTRIDALSERVTTIEKTITTLPTKDDLARIIADTNGESTARLRKEDKKVNMHIQFNKEKGVLTGDQVKALNALQIFPSIEV